MLLCLIYFVGFSKIRDYGETYLIKEAYENGYIFYDDLKTPAYYQNNGNGGNEGIIGDNFIPKDNKVYNIFYKYQLKATLSSNF